MKKLFFSVFAFVICLNLQGQEIELPNLSSQSPNAFQFTKYGEVNVNESTGVISPSIPLYSYKAGGIEIPIILNYTGNAVKVAQSPTWVGINWNLTPGGAITRQVRDLPDEKISLDNKRFFSRQEANDLEGYGVIEKKGNYYVSWHGIAGTEWYNTMEAIGNSTNNIDSEADVFNYSFLGYSGSFYLDENLEAHLLNYNKELKIEFVPDSTPDSNKSTIYITTPQGDKYSFGGENASESSRTYVNSGAGSTVGINHAQNAFYLYKVEPYKGGYINFTYTQVNTSGLSNVHVVDEYEHLKKRRNLISSCGETYIYSGIQDIYEEVQSRVMLTKISSDLNSGSVDFSSSFLDNRMRKLQTVFVKKENDSILKKFTFNYSTNTAIEKHVSDKKFFLTDVNFHDKNGVKIYDYNLKYNNQDGLPNKFSMAKDENGYFNNVTTNKTLLPYNSRFQGTITLANRKTNPRTLQYGSLSKITYPTGGYSTFDYEVPIKDYNQGININYLNVYHRAVDRNDSSDYEDVLWKDRDNTFQFNKGKKIDVNLSIEADGDFRQGTYVRLYAKNRNVEHEVYEFHFPYTTDNNAVQSFNPRIQIEIPETGEYVFKLVLTPHSTVNNSNRFSVIARLNIPNETQIPVYYPSLRIKRVNTFNPSSKEPIVKRFYYNSLGNLTEDNSTLLSGFNHVNTTTVRRNTSQEGCSAPGPPIAYLNLSTSALNNTFIDDSRKIIYPVVSVSYGGDNFEQGGKQSVFRVNPGSPIDLYFGTSENNGELLEVFVPSGDVLSYDNGKLLSEKIVSYNSSAEQFKTLKETSYVYRSLNTNTVHRMNNIKASRVQTGVVTDMRKYNFSFYQLISKKNLLTTRTTKEYLDNLSEPIITSESYQYGTYVDRPSETEITNSNGVKKKIKYYYPDDVLDTGSLGHDDLSLFEFNAIKYLKKDNLHNLNQVQTETYIYQNSTPNLLSTKRALYGLDASIVVLPETIQTSKGTAPLEDRIVYHKYDDKGNPVEISKKDGTKIYYVWGYHKTQPIAKIEGYTDAQITAVQTKIKTAVTASNSDTSRCLDSDNCNEKVLRDKLTLLRNSFTSTNTQVTTYTYDPLIGVTSMTDPKGYTIYYEYDEFNRLKQVKDADGNILSNNQYNYKN